MAALNLQVDPKRIEAHENEEPPTYEPTDENLGETTPATKSNAKIDTNRNENDYTEVFEGEVVVEDAEEERRAEALATQETNNNSTTTTQSSSSIKNDDEQDSFWSTKGEDQSEPGAGSIMEGFSRENDVGPSMDDFFGGAFADDENPMDAKGDEGTKQTEPPSTSAATTGTTKKETPDLVSLVPKKTNSKMRRPKIRPSRRKK